MAHFKRKRPRTALRRHRPSGRSFSLRSWPARWDIIYHTRPHRRRAQHMLAAIKSGRIDPDAAAWPLSKKPHYYYW